MTRALRCDGFLDGLEASPCRLSCPAYVSGYLAGCLARQRAVFGRVK